MLRILRQVETISACRDRDLINRGQIAPTVVPEAVQPDDIDALFRVNAHRRVTRRQSNRRLRRFP